MPAKPPRTPPANASAGLSAPADLPDRLDRIETWIFDLDNTLYPAASNLFAQVDRRMGAFIAERLGLAPEEARALQKRYFHQHGTTLRGLMDNHGIDPYHYLDYVHAIDVTPVPPSPALDAVLHRLPGRKVIFTNGSVAHARNVTDRLGVTHHFPEVFDIVAAGFTPKPAAAPYGALCARHGIRPGRAILFEDMACNLEPAAALGMVTVLVHTDPSAGGVRSARDVDDAAFVHHRTHDLTAWLEAAVATLGAG